jgi:two-component system, OmpR family, sensor histidine kinase QseC
MTGGPSIRRRLLTMLISTILAVWLVVLVLVFGAARHEVQEVFDADMARSARILQVLLLHEVQEEQEFLDKAREVEEELGEDGLRAYPRLTRILREVIEREGKEQSALVMIAQDAGQRYRAGLMFVARHADGSVLMSDHSAPAIPSLPDGFSDVRLGSDDWRIYGVTDALTGLNVQVGERQAFRAELVRYITGNTLMPMLVALPVLGILIWVVVGRALAPLRRVARAVSMRATDALDPIGDDGAPYEIHGLLTALNRLFGRVGTAIRRERQFTADAAHELRTPLAALKTHLQVAQAQSAEPTTRDFLDQALASVDRATHSVEQLLQLARADAEQTRALVNARVNLREVAVWVVSVLSQRAYERAIDLGVDAPATVEVRGDGGALRVLLRNLVDNAVRYTPIGGTVTVSLGRGEDGPWLEVADDGVGVAIEEHEKVFDRFHRGPGEQAMGSAGSGLGLAIVKRIADLHDARITLGEGLHGRGLSIRITFPPGEPVQAPAAEIEHSIPAPSRF